MPHTGRAYWASWLIRTFGMTKYRFGSFHPEVNRAKLPVNASFQWRP